MQLIKLLTDDDNFFGGDDYSQSIEPPNRQTSSPINYQGPTPSTPNHKSPTRHTPSPVYETPNYQSPTRPTPSPLNYKSSTPTSIKYQTSRSIRLMIF